MTQDTETPAPCPESLGLSYAGACPEFACFAFKGHYGIPGRRHKMFTTDNTENFTAADLKILNAAAAIIAARNPELREYSINDALTNAWVGGQSAEQLADATGF